MKFLLHILLNTNMNEKINFDQSVDGIYSCIAFLLTMHPGNKEHYAKTIVDKMNNIMFQDKKESFNFYKMILLDILEKENQELSQTNKNEDKFMILNNLKCMKELKAIEKQ